MNTDYPKQAGHSSCSHVLAVMLVFILQQASQLAVTPIGEDMDFYGHWAYITFYAQEGHWPRPDDLSFPDRLKQLREVLPAPDHTDGSRYRHWAQLTNDQKSYVRSYHLSPITDHRYIAPNPQAQHPPLYYWFMSRVYPGVQAWNLDFQRYTLALISIVIASLAFPAIYFTLRHYVEASTAGLILLGIAWFPNLMPFLGRVSNDSLAFTLLSWFMWLCVGPGKTIRHVILAGLLLGTALFTKTYALTFVPVYLICFGFRRTHAAIAGLLVLLALGALAYSNFSMTGHWLLLTEIRNTQAIGFLDKCKGLFSLDPIWFFGGLAKGFFWCGYWSFVSPGYFYYLPLLAPAALLLYRPRAMFQQREFLSLPKLWPHFLALVFFVLGMMWHANLFKLHAQSVGATIFSGNEGWYMDVLIGSVAAIMAVWAHNRFGSGRQLRWLTFAIPMIMLWNMLARWVMYMFWSGRVTVSGHSRLADWRQILSASFDPSAYTAWWSCPGIIHPLMLTFVLPGLAAVLITLATMRRLSMVSVPSR